MEPLKKSYDGVKIRFFDGDIRKVSEICDAFEKWVEELILNESVIYEFNYYIFQLQKNVLKKYFFLSLS